MREFHDSKRRKVNEFNPQCIGSIKLEVWTKILILILEGIIKKISYERRDYESVDEKILS